MTNHPLSDHYQTCPCGKRGFYSRRAARASRRQIHAKGQSMHAYHCEHSGHWHLGHRPPGLSQGHIDRDTINRWKERRHAHHHL